ncbi:MAG TPA: hypothetical protein PKE04_20050, partial [Clostridia bacterium]|nr:hypothetical protein [Clostridia bacterium]
MVANKSAAISIPRFTPSPLCLPPYQLVLSPFLRFLPLCDFRRIVSKAILIDTYPIGFDTILWDDF